MPRISHILEYLLLLVIAKLVGGWWWMLLVAAVVAAFWWDPWSPVEEPLAPTETYEPRGDQ